MIVSQPQGPHHASPAATFLFAYGKVETSSWERTADPQAIDPAGSERRCSVMLRVLPEAVHQYLDSSTVS